MGAMVADYPQIVAQDHIGLVQHLARSLAGKGVPKEDLFQEGYLGLMEAAKRFNPAFGNRFSSYACPYIRGFMLTLISKNKRSHQPLSAAPEPVYESEKFDDIGDKIDLVALIQESPLSDYQRAILELWLGVATRPQSCTRIGKKFGRTKQRAHQHIKDALAMVRDHLVQRGVSQRAVLLRQYCGEN